LDTLRTAVETLIRLVKAGVHEDAVLVAPDDIFEVKRVPSVLLQGPTLVENGARRTMARTVEKDVASLTYSATPAPRLYHLDFDLVVTTGHEGDLLDLQERIARFYQRHRILAVADRGTLNVTELVPLGGLRRVNLSNLRQSSGRLRVEDCPVFDGRVETGPLIRDRRFEYRGGVESDRVHPPEPRNP
jgi:hypothetical protein